MKKRLQTATLLLAAVATVAIPFASGSGGTAFRHPEPVVAHAEGDEYKKLSVDLAAATAFDDARAAIKAADASESDSMQGTFESNLRTLTSGEHFGNVGLFVGPKGSSKNSDVWSVFQSKVTVDNAQIKAYDSITGSAFSKYKAFGGAVQKLNARSQKAKGSASSMQKGLDELSAAGAKITNLGTELMVKYNPAPLVLALLDINQLNIHPDNELVKLVNSNANAYAVFSILGSPTRFGVSLVFLILFFGIFLLLITSGLMTLINGRAAGENIRKMIVKIVIGCITIPLLAKALDAGVGFLDHAAAIQANSPQANYVEQNLNLADWYACGFSLPTGTSVSIDKNGQFVLSPGAVRAINTHTYRQVWGKANPTDDEMMDKMEEYYNLFKAFPQGVGFSEPVLRNTNGKAWRTKNFYATLSNFGQNKPLTDEIDVDEAGNAPAMANVGYYMTNGLSMSRSGDGWVISGTSAGNRYGISPIAATNLMRTTFTGSAMTVNSNSTMGGVVFDVDNGPGTGTSQMSSLTRFLATFALVMAALKGLFTIFSAGFAGVIAGGAKGAVGSSSGFGQAVGGVLALIGGVFGISIIMTMSFTLLDQMYGVLQNLLSGTTAGNDILEPFKEVVEGVPLLGPLLGDALKSVARFVLTILCAITLPKFGGIPVTLFCQYMAELPHSFAERAQQIENKFTGDFRGGAGGRMGGGMAGASSLANQALNNGKAQGKAMAAGLGAAAGALGAYGLSKMGAKLGDKYEGADIGEEGAGSVSGEGAEAMPENVGRQAEEAAAEAAMAEAASEGANAERPDNAGADAPEHGQEPSGSGDTVMDVEGGTVNADTVDGNDLKESENESISDHDEGDSMETQTSESSAESDSTASNSVMSEEASSESSMSDTAVDAEQAAETMLHAEESSMSDVMNEATSDAEHSASASMHSDSDTTVETGSAGASMSDSGREQPSQGSGLGARAEAGASASSRASMASHSGMPSASTTSGDRRRLTREQARNRRMQALAAGMQAAGGHTTKGQMMAGVAAGAAHMAGAAVGAQNVTGRGVSAVRNHRQRQNDIRQGLPSNYSQRQREQNERMRQPVPGNGTPGGNQNPILNRRPTRIDPAHREAILGEAEAVMSYYAERDERRRRQNASRFEPRRTDQD